MRILGLCSFPAEAAATRFRMVQYVEPLRDLGIDLNIKPFLTREQFSSLYKPGRLLRKSAGMVPRVIARMLLAAELGDYDLIFVQREAMIFGPAFFEWLYQQLEGIPLVLDLDDATYVKYISPVYGKFGSMFKFFGKTDAVIQRSACVVCGNRFIAEHVSAIGSKSVVIPTIVDTDIFKPVTRDNPVPVIGWIGTHSTYPFLRSLFPVLQKLAKKHEFILRIVGSGLSHIRVDGLTIEDLEWSGDREVIDFQTLDIGLYPLAVSSHVSTEWLMGKSGFKAIQYMAVGVPFVMAPIGVCAEMGNPGETHFLASTPEEWLRSLDRLLRDPKLRMSMGANGRRHSLANYTLGPQARKLAEVFHDAVGKSIRELSR